MTNNLVDEELTSREACENRLSLFFVNKGKGLYERAKMSDLEIMKMAKSFRAKRGAEYRLLSSVKTN